MGLGCPVLIALQCLKSNVHLLLMYAAFKVCTHTALTWTGIQPKAGAEARQKLIGNKKWGKGERKKLFFIAIHGGGSVHVLVAVFQHCRQLQLRTPCVS